MRPTPGRASASITTEPKSSRNGKNIRRTGSAYMVPTASAAGVRSRATTKAVHACGVLMYRSCRAKSWPSPNARHEHRGFARLAASVDRPPRDVRRRRATARHRKHAIRSRPSRRSRNPCAPSAGDTSVAFARTPYCGAELDACRDHRMRRNSRPRSTALLAQALTTGATPAPRRPTAIPPAPPRSLSDDRMCVSYESPLGVRLISR